MPTVQARPEAGADDEPIGLALTHQAYRLLHPARLRREGAPVWLPLQPLRDATAVHVSIAVLAALAGVTTRTACRWIGRGEVPDDGADRIACSLGLHPCLIWGAAWWDLADVDLETVA
jgi:hypothetical protein